MAPLPETCGTPAAAGDVSAGRGAAMITAVLCERRMPASAEYALEAVRKGTTAVAVKGMDAISLILDFRFADSSRQATISS